MSTDPTQPKTGSAHGIGLRGERVAAAVARARGWQVQGMRLRTPVGEADIFATRRCPADRLPGRSEAPQAIGVVIEVKTALGRWPSTDLVHRRRQARLWRVAAHLGEQAGLAELEVVVALVRLERNHEAVRWIPLDAW